MTVCLRASISLVLLFLPNISSSEENIVGCENRGVPYIGKEVGLPDVIMNSSGVEPMPEGQDGVPGVAGGLDPTGQISVRAGAVEIKSDGNNRAVTVKPGEDLEFSIFLDAASGLLTIVRGAIVAIAAKTPAPWLKNPPVPRAGRSGGRKACARAGAECGDGSNLLTGGEKTCAAPTKCFRDKCECGPNPLCSDASSTCKLGNPAGPHCTPPQTCRPNAANNKICHCSGQMAQASFDSEDFTPMEYVEEDLGEERAVSGGTSGLERGGLGGTWYQVYDYPGSYLEVSEDGQYLSWYARGTWQLYERKFGSDYRLIQESDPGGQVTRYEWANELVRKDFPGGRIDYVYGVNKLNVNFSRCDAKHEQCVVKEYEGQEYEFNQFGQVTKARGDHLPAYSDVTGTTISAPRNEGVEYRYEYDNSGKLYEVYVEREPTELLVVRYGYDNRGRLVQTTDAIGQTVDFSYPSGREVVATTNQSVSRFSFDTENRIIDFWSQLHPSEPYSRVKIEYSGPGCGQRVHKYEVDTGSGNFVTAAINDWSTDENRLLSKETYAPDGTPIITTYNQYTEKIDGNQPQKITVEGLGTSTIEYSFKPAKDKLDARLLVDSVKSTSPRVTDIDGKKSVIESFVKLNDLGRPEHTESRGLVTRYLYDERGLISQVLSGPSSGAAGEPDMSETSYAVRVERDPKTDEIVKYIEGSGASQLVISSKYEKGALVEQSFPGGGKVTYRYNWFGGIAAEEVLALNDKGQPLAPGARTKYTTKLVEVGPYGEVKQLSFDIGDPTKAVAEYSSISYERDAAGKVIRVVPSIGEATWYGYVGNVLKEVRIGGASGTVIRSFSSTPTSQTVRQLLGKSNGQLNYVDLVSRFNQFGDLIEKESIQFNRKVVFKYDPFGRADGIKQFIGTNLVSEERIILDEFGRAIEGHRVNPRTQEVDVVSRVKYAGNQLAATYDIFGNPTVYNYDRGGALKIVKSNTEELMYDYLPGAGVVSKVTHKTKDLTSVVSYKYANGRVSEEQYLGNGSGSTQPLFRKFFYDTLGRVLGVTDHTGRTYRQIVGPDGFLWSSKSDELQIAWKRAIDSATGQVTVQRFVNNEPPTTKIFNKYGLFKHVDFDGKTTEVNYSSVGDRDSISYPDGTVATFTRDNKNRVTQMSVPDPTGVTNWLLGFDNQDLVNKVTMTRGAQVSEMEALGRGDFGEVTKVAWRENGRAPVVASFNYKAPNGITIPGLSFGGEIGGVSVSKDIDLKTGKLKSLKYAGNIVPGGEVEFKMDGNTLQYPASTNLRSDWEYDEFGMLKRVVANQNNQILHGAEYTYNSAMQTAKVEKVNGDGYAYEYLGSRLVKATNLNTNKTTEIEYDSKYPQRRTRVTRADGSVVNYQYDEIGRLVALDVGGAVHQLSYDVLGRVTEIKIIGGDTWSYIYDTNGYNPKPAEVKENGGVVRTFEYDINGNLKSTSANGQQEHDLNIGTLSVGKVNPATGLLSELYVNFPGVARERIATLAGSQSNYFTHDHHLTTERAFDANGNLVEQYGNNLAEEDFKIFTAAGAQINSSAIGYDAGFHNLRSFPDAAPITLGPLYLANHRVGTMVGFLSEDVLDTAGKRYQNTNNPVNFSDPNGTQEQGIGGGAPMSLSLDVPTQLGAAGPIPGTTVVGFYGGQPVYSGGRVEGGKTLGERGLLAQLDPINAIFGELIAQSGYLDRYDRAIADISWVAEQERQMLEANSFLTNYYQSDGYAYGWGMTLSQLSWERGLAANAWGFGYWLMIDFIPSGAVNPRLARSIPDLPAVSQTRNGMVRQARAEAAAPGTAPLKSACNDCGPTPPPGQSFIERVARNEVGPDELFDQVSAMDKRASDIGSRINAGDGIVGPMRADYYATLSKMEGVKLTPGDLRNSTRLKNSPEFDLDLTYKDQIRMVDSNGSAVRFGSDCGSAYLRLESRMTDAFGDALAIDLTSVDVFLVPVNGGQAIKGRIIPSMDGFPTVTTMLDFDGVDMSLSYNVFVTRRGQ